jgi:hypothetical protein
MHHYTSLFKLFKSLTNLRRKIHVKINLRPSSFTHTFSNCSDTNASGVFLLCLAVPCREPMPVAPVAEEKPVMAVAELFSLLVSTGLDALQTRLFLNYSNVTVTYILFMWSILL